MVHEINTIQRLSGAIVALMLIVGCGRAKRGDYDEVITPSQQAEQNHPTVEDKQQTADATYANANFGLRRGDQIVANLEAVTGVKFDSLDANTQTQVRLYQDSAPGESTVNKFTAGNLAAAFKLSTIFCSVMVDREVALRGNAQGDKTKLIFKNIDIRGNNLALTLSKKNKEDLSNQLMNMFWGGLADEADRSKMVELSLNFIDDATAGVADKNLGDIPARIIKGMCTAISSSWSGLST